MRRPRVLFSSETGHTAFYALAVVPLVLGISALAIDVSGWNALRDTLQVEADHIAFQAVQQLPSLDGVEAVLAAEEARLSQQGVSLEPRVGGETPGAYVESNGLGIGVRMKASFRPVFSFFVPGLIERNPSLFSVTRESAAHIVPTDFVFILPDGATLRPSGDYSLQSFSDPWGASHNWPASGYFNCVSPPSEDWGWERHWASVEFRRWVTQSCFNPVITPLKLAAISLIDVFSASRANRVGVIFTPGDDSEQRAVIARHVRDAGGGFFDGSLEAEWSDYRVPNHRFNRPLEDIDKKDYYYFGDHLCVVFSDPAVDFGGRYKLPPKTESLLSGVTRPHYDTAVEYTPCGNEHRGHQPLTNPEHRLLSPAYFRQQGLELREAVYWRSAKLKRPGFSAAPDIIYAIRQAWGELVDTPDEILNREKQMRGNLAGFAFRKIVVLTDSLDLGPPGGAGGVVEDLLTTLSAARIELIIAGFINPYAKNEVALRNSLQTFETVAAKLQQDNKVASNTLRIISVASPEELQTIAAPQLAALGRSVALKR